MSSRSNWISCSLGTLGGVPAPPGTLLGVWASIEMLDISSVLTSTKTANIGRMGKKPPQSKPTWADVKAKLAGFDRRGLMCLVQDLYVVHRDNQAFLHAPFGLGEDVLNLSEIDRWMARSAGRRPNWFARHSPCR